MSTMMGKSRRVLLSGLVAAVASVALLGTAWADLASDKAGAIIIYPKIVVDTEGVLGPPTDTEIQLTNTSNQVVSARCFLIDTTSRCVATGAACTEQTEAGPEPRCAPGDSCEPGWVDNNFRMTLTKRQPIAWRASEGLTQFPCDITNPEFGNCPFGQSNSNQDDGSPSFIRPTQDDPFFGELRCVQVRTDTFQPTPGVDPANDFAGDLAGHATIVTGDSIAYDARKYNAITLASRSQNNGDDELVLGGPGAEYDGCPNVLTLNHFFDDASLSTHQASAEHQVRTDLTVVPCGADYELDIFGQATLQFLVFNEFEQRLSASTSVDCWRETVLSDLDSRPGPFGDAQSIFNIGVQGTFGGQTRIRSVAGVDSANAVLGVAEEFIYSTNGLGAVGGGANFDGPKRSTGFNIHYTGSRDVPDILSLSSDSTN